MSHSTRQFPTHRPITPRARAAAASQAITARIALTSLVLSVVLGLLAGAVWTLTT